MDRQRASKISGRERDESIIYYSRDFRDRPSRDTPLHTGALSLHRSASRKSHRVGRATSTSCGLCTPDLGSTNSNIADNPLASYEQPNWAEHEPLSSQPSSPIDPSLLCPENDGSALSQAPRTTLKNISWFSLPFTSLASSRRVRQSILSAVHLIVLEPSGRSNDEDLHNLFSSMAESCVEHELSLSAILQERSIAGHTPMYWAIVNYREKLLVELLTHSRPLSISTISDIRRACLASSNQALFHALRVRCRPFHGTQGLHVPSPLAPSDNLLLDSEPMDKIDVRQSRDEAIVVSFEIHRWKRRINAIGHVGIEFIAAGRMWSITFFSAHTSSLLAMPGREKEAGTWHVMVKLLESSSPTFFDSQIMIDPLPPLVEEPNQTRTLRTGARSRSNRAEIARTRSIQHGSPLPSPIRPRSSSHSSSSLISANQLPISIKLSANDRKLGCRVGESSKIAKTLTTKPSKWSNHGVGYTSAVVSPFSEHTISQLMRDPSPYLFHDGTLTGRLEARFVKIHCVNVFA